LTAVPALTALTAFHRPTPATIIPSTVTSNAPIHPSTW
jgi:hypothetical protein